MKTVIVPIDKEAEFRMEYNEESESDVIMICFSEDDNDKLWEARLYSAINKEINAGIDEGESAVISGEEVLKVLYSILDKYEKKVVNPIIPTLKSLTTAAIRFGTSVHFYY